LEAGIEANAAGPRSQKAAMQELSRRERPVMSDKWYIRHRGELCDIQPEEVYTFVKGQQLEHMTNEGTGLQINHEREISAQINSEVISCMAYRFTARPTFIGDPRANIGREAYCDYDLPEHHQESSGMRRF
jgi:hypothetical protein